MIISDRMKVKHISTIFLFLLFEFLLFGSKVKAIEPTFSFYPKGGIIVDKTKGFSVDVLIDTGNQAISSAKFTILFDPTVLKLTNVEKNSSLFVQWPEDEMSVDNDNGVILLTGFTQSGTGDPYMTSGDSDIMARLTFKVLQDKVTYLDWEYDTSNGVFDTYMMKDGSPPVNVLLNKPVNATFQIGDIVVKPGDVKTGIFDAKYLVAAGVVLFLFGGFMVFTRPSLYRKRRGTVVVYDEKE